MSCISQDREASSREDNLLAEQTQDAGWRPHRVLRSAGFRGPEMRDGFSGSGGNGGKGLGVQASPQLSKTGWPYLFSHGGPE